MARKPYGRRVFPDVSFDSIRILNSLIPFRMSQSITARSDKFAIAVLQKFLGVDWLNTHIRYSSDGFLRCETRDESLREVLRMRRITLAEMLFNLQKMGGFRSCLVELYGGQIEPTYAALEIGRLLCTQALDREMTFRFVTPSGIKKRDYDLSIRFSDGIRACAETKCKIEETKITLRTIEESLSIAKGQLPERVPGIIFIKTPRIWIEDESFAQRMRDLADRFLARSPSIISVKYYVVSVVQERDSLGESIGEVVSVQERLNPKHRFKTLAGRDWRMFPSVPGPIPRPRTNYNGLPDTWQRLIVNSPYLVQARN
jgi:hypothetical protein